MPSFIALPREPICSYQSKNRKKIRNKITIIYMVSESWVVRVRVPCGHSYRVRVALWTEFGRVWYKVRSIFRTCLFQNLNFVALLYFHHLFIDMFAFENDTRKYIWFWLKLWLKLFETVETLVETFWLKNTLSFE